MGFSDVQGLDGLLPEPPPLVAPPLSLLDLARTLIDDEGDVAELREATERAASSQMLLADVAARVEAGSADNPDEQFPHSPELQQLQREYQDAMKSAADTAEWVKDLKLRMAATERWERGFLYLPELPLGATSVFAEDSRIAEAGLDPAATGLKPTGNNQSPTLWYDPFEVEARDERSLFPPNSPVTSFEARAQRAARAARAHEAWQCEAEFWSGVKVPTNFHLTASPHTPTTSSHRTIDAWTDPSPAPGTILGTAVGLAQALAALDQAIAEADAGTGMIHATPYLVQQWMKTFPYIRDSSGRVYTVNMNLLVPGYGYPGTGPDPASRAVTDGVLTQGSTTLASATGAFTTADIGSTVTDSAAGIPAGTVIVAITDATHAVMSQAATSAEAGDTVTIGAATGRLGGHSLEWAFATDSVFKCRGEIQAYPAGYEQGGPLTNVDNAVAVRNERPWALITNQLLRAAVLVDSTQP